jgi:2,4-dienoyl-CoA reductase-like NADH-dependent reductase (Old Yellow Enzyme family)
MGRIRSTDGVLAPSYAGYYRRRAEGGASLIIGEASCVADPAADGYRNASHLHGAAAIAAWAEVARQVHWGGGSFVPQLWHSGATRAADAPDPDAPTRSPSGRNLADRDGARILVDAGRPMGPADIEKVIAAYLESALAARRIGCDAIEIHGAHGYLIDQFLWPPLNERRDAYGGSIENRVRFAVELVGALRAALGPDFPIIFRFSQWKMQDFEARLCETPQELEAMLVPIVRAGVDILHCSQRRYWQPEFPDSDLNLAGWAKKLTGAATITVGSVGLDVDFASGPRGLSEGKVKYVNPCGIERLIEMLDRGDFDLVALGRALITNPDWAHLVRAGETDRLRPFSRDALATIE